MQRLITLFLAVAMVCSLSVFASAKQLVVATDTNFKPFSYKDSTGTYVGFDVELWDAVAKEMDLDYKLQPMDFNGIIPGLQSGNVDVAVAGMSVKADREEVIDFCFPYYKAGLVILVPANNTDVKGIEDLEGKVVATKLATSSVDYLRSNANLKELKQFPNISDAFMELQAGGCDAVFFDLPPLQDFANNAGKGQVKVVGPLYMGHYYAMAVPQGSPHREAIDRGILRLMENGTYDTIYRKWFGEDPR